MSTTSPSITNAWELCEAIGADKDEGVEVALFPESLEAAWLGPEFRWDKDTKGYPVMATLKDWGERLIDVVTEPAKPVKWWRVRESGRELKLAWLPVSWQGPISEIPEKYFADKNMGIRFFSDGPWFWPIQNTHLETNLEVLRGLAT